MPMTPPRTPAVADDSEGDDEPLSSRTPAPTRQATLRLVSSVTAPSNPQHASQALVHLGEEPIHYLEETLLEMKASVERDELVDEEKRKVERTKYTR